MNTLHTRMGLGQISGFLRTLPALLSGQGPDPTGGAIHDLQLALGVQALSLIKEAYIEKARGGVDEAGIKWAPLKRETVAGRNHPGDPHKKRGERPRGLLTAEEDKRWRQVFAQTCRRRIAEGDNAKEAAGRAAATAWTVVKASGARTFLADYGDMQVEILRDTNRLFNSLSPGVDGPSGDPDQIFRHEADAVIVGTNVIYALIHHYGDPKRNIPARPLWPEPDIWPETWKETMLDTAGRAVVELVERFAA